MAPILLVLLALLCGWALALVLALGLAPIPAITEDCPDCLLAEGVVRGDVEQVVGGTRIQTAKIVDQGLTSCPREECTDDVRDDDIWEGVASFGEPMDVIL